MQRPDDFASRRRHLQGLSDAELHARFWELTERLVAPLLAEARSHTSPSIERSVLLRMGFSSIEASALVRGMQDRGLLRYGAGQLLLRLAQAQGLGLRDAGVALLHERLWPELESIGASL
jgi:D-ornithine 4,5-aminomutase subunit alpha